MSVKYQEDQKECYEKMMEEIAGHSDFGKRNPVDIGIDCGYTEEKVMEMIQFLQDFNERPETGDRNGDDRETYYFLLANSAWDHYIASVNINTWDTKWVKDVETMPDCFQIKGAIYAYVANVAQGEVLAWENLETGDKETLQVDGSIQDILIADNGIAVITEKFFVLHPYQGEKTQIEHSFIGRQMLIEGKDAIYVISVDSYGYGSSEIWKVEKESLHESVIWNCRGKEIVVAEYADEDLIWYIEEPHLSGYRKYSEKNLPDYEGEYKLPSVYIERGYGCIDYVRTKNYELLQGTIFSIKDKNRVCEFDRIRLYGKWITYGNVMGIYEKDIFVGVRRGGQDIIKIDLRDEREPVILPRPACTYIDKSVRKGKDILKGYKKILSSM